MMHQVWLESRLVHIFFCFTSDNLTVVFLCIAGPLKRIQSERLLEGKIANSFLVRISESFLGYVITHKSHDGILNHFFVQLSKRPPKQSDEEEDGEASSCTPTIDTNDSSSSRTTKAQILYHFYGHIERQFCRLTDLVEYYQVSFFP